MTVQDFTEHINTSFPFLKESKIIIAISGGIDSVVLAHLCKKCNFNFALAHCNFNLRGKESDDDETFVLNLADELDVECFVQHFDTNAYAELNKTSIQMAARELRYNWFQDLVEQLHFDYILTAHHADDNLETFLINFMRGTGINGLTGIPAINNNVLRPLLSFSRADIEGYAKANTIQWREDLSNNSRKYLRNKLRHEVVPILKDINPQLLDGFQQTIEYLKGTETIVKQNLDTFKKQAETKSDYAITAYRVSAFKTLDNPKAYLFELLRTYGFTEWNDVQDLLEAQSGKFVQSNTHRLIKHRDLLLLAEINTESQSPIIISENENVVETPIGELHLKTAKTIKQVTASKVYVDKTKLKFPLTIRPWKDGDRFQPSGMQGQKKVSKYLKDEKVSLLEKENTWVLTSEDNIVWIVGKRMDERFKVSETTTQILKLIVNK